MNVITISREDVLYFMTEDVVVTLTDGNTITADEVTVLERTGGEWLRCIRRRPSDRMGFDETTTYYHIERDVERVSGRETGDVRAQSDIDRQAMLALASTRSDS
jgi:hypothetical protein